MQPGLASADGLGVPATMRVQVSNARLLRDLLQYLRECGCVAEQASTTEADVFLPELESEPAARLELGIYLAAWRVRHEGVAAVIIGPAR
jgi:hypothetical protein